MDIKKEYERWLANATADADVVAELKTLDDAKIEDAFYRDLAFGTGGLRGVIGAGTNRMNIYTVAKASQGLADYLKKNFETPSVAIGYDSRIKSDVFAKVAAGVFAANGVKVNIWPVLMPVPTVSFATRYLHTSAGVMVTASHNPSKYNGYKVYGADGCQITTEAAAEILAEIEKLDIFADVKTSDFDAGVANGSSMIIHSEMPTDVFNICGGYFALIGYVLVQNLTISKEQIQKIFVNYTKLIVLFFFIQYAIFKISGNIIFIDFYNPQMRAGFLRAGVGSEFVALSIIIMFAEFLQTYRKKKRFDIKLIIWMGIFSVYFVLFICIRAAILAIFLSCLVLVFIGTDSRKLKLGILLLGVLGGALILQSSVFDKYMQIDKIEGGGSITGRLAMYAYYFNGFMQHPIMGQGFIKPINSALTTLLYGPYGFYYLEDVGIVGCLFTFGLVGVFLFLTFITKGMKTIISGYKDRSIFSDSVVLGVFMFLVFTMPTLFLFDYARNGFLMFVLLFMTPKSERN